MIIVAAAVAVRPDAAAAGRAATLLLLVLQVGMEIRQQDRTFFISPPFILSTLVLICFSLFPAAVMALLTLLATQDLAARTFGGISYRPEVAAYFGSTAERLVLAFSMLVMAAHGIVRIAVPPRPAPDGQPGRFRLIYAISVGYAVVYFAGTQWTLFGGGAAALLHTTFGPVQSFMMLWLLHGAVAGRKIAPLWVALLFGANIFLMFLTYGGKIPVLIVIAGIFLFLGLRYVSYRTLAKIGVLVLLFLAIAMPVIQSNRTPPDGVLETRGAFSHYFASVVLSKAHWRQVETGFCLNNVIRDHGSQSFSPGKQLFWLEILVPRLIWPAKPDFSRGRHYAVEYCKLPPAGPHSASITLLGQPILKGGMAGLLLHGGVLLLILGSLGAVARAFPGLPRVVVFALLPWWVDFDQDFALYVGNLLKFGLIMVPLILIARGGASRGSSG